MTEFDQALVIKPTAVVIKKAALAVEPSCKHTLSTCGDCGSLFDKVTYLEKTNPHVDRLNYKLSSVKGQHCLHPSTDESAIVRSRGWGLTSYKHLLADVKIADVAMLTARNERWVTTPSPLRITDKLGQYMKA